MLNQLLRLFALVTTIFIVKLIADHLFLFLVALQGVGLDSNDALEGMGLLVLFLIQESWQEAKRVD